jgi:hypothetical protein
MGRVLRREDRLDEIGESVLVLARSSAELVDGSTLHDAPVYARANALTAHAQILAQLGKLVGRADADDIDALPASIVTASSPGPPWGTIAQRDLVSGAPDSRRSGAWPSTGIIPPSGRSPRHRTAVLARCR